MYVEKILGLLNTSELFCLKTAKNRSLDLKPFDKVRHGHSKAGGERRSVCGRSLNDMKGSSSAVVSRQVQIRSRDRKSVFNDVMSDLSESRNRASVGDH
jgi:hypothetical protein